MNATVAAKQKYQPLTTGYTAAEADLLSNVIQDMRRGNIDFVIVENPEGLPEVWRQPAPK